MTKKYEVRVKYEVIEKDDPKNIYMGGKVISEFSILDQAASLCNKLNDAYDAGKEAGVKDGTEIEREKLRAASAPPF